MAKLSPQQISEKLKSLAGWEHKGDTIAKLYKFKEFMDGIHFINGVAKIAEKMDHHPDIAINYTRITFSCSTHDQGGITEKDFKLAGEIESAFKASGQ
ncbi:MAG TPA: 4a-hydroxytetrahydrobiopterin dehydratase [Candidatus Binataceae bacterium]|nr:4a-hydroxytetrahydrobiopterin dehydratase [Candidatus Binataceae bacterium]